MNAALPLETNATTQRIKTRLGELQAEREKGAQALAQMQESLAGVENALYRIDGAIQILEELLAQPTE